MRPNSGEIPQKPPESSSTPTDMATYIPPQNTSTYIPPPGHLRGIIFRPPGLDCTDRRLAVGSIFKRDKITFAGVKNEDSLEFLSKIKDCIVANNLSEDETLRALTGAFTGTALEWYRIERCSITSYDEFFGLFKRLFCPTDMAIWQDISRRSQGPNEPMFNYVVFMRHLFSYLDNPTSLDEQLYMITRNIHPRYATGWMCRTFKSYKELVQAGRELDRIFDEAQRREPPPRPEDSMLPQFAYVPPGSKKNNNRQKNIS